MREHPNLAGNPLKIKPNKKYAQIFRKPPILASNTFKNEAKRKVWKSEIYENFQILLEILLKIKPNEKHETLKFCKNLQIWLEILNKKILKYLNFGENLKIWLEILNKKKLKFWLQTTTWNRLLLKPFLKNTYPHKEFFFREGNPPTCSEY